MKRKFSLHQTKQKLKELLTLSFFLSLDHIFFILAVKDTMVLNATVFVNTTPIFSVFISSFIFRLKRTHLVIAGLAVSFVGVSIIAFTEAIAPDTGSKAISPSFRGDLEAVFAAFVEAFCLNFDRKIRSQMNILSIMLLIYALTAIIIGILSLPASHAISTVPVQVTTILSLLGLGLLPTAAAHTPHFSFLSNLKSFETATLGLLEPVGATLLGIAVFEEVPAPVFAFGATLVLMGIVFIGRTKGQNRWRCTWRKRCGRLSKRVEITLLLQIFSSL